MDETASDSKGDRARPPLDSLFARCYEELRILARRALSGENPNHTLQPTDLVHEVYSRLSRSNAVDPNDRVHFIRLTARAMRNYLVDYARRKNARSRGGHLRRVTLTGDMGLAPDQFELVPLGTAMEALEKLHERQAWVVDMRFIGGLTLEETAAELGVSRRTVIDDQAMALAFLRREISRSDD